MIIRSFTIAFLAVGLLALAPEPTIVAQERADLILHNGKIFAADNLMSIHQAIVVRDGRIVAVGGESLARQYLADRLIDLRGRLVTPGFNDTHIHIGGTPRRQVNLAGSRSMAELLARITQKAAELGSGEWVAGRAWSEDELAEQRRPLRADLDSAELNNPVVITRAGGHSSVVNTRALALAGITSTTVPPDGGIIELDAQGEPNGVLRETAQTLVRRLVPDSTAEELRNSFVQNLRNLLELGITSIIFAGARGDGYAEWEEVYKQYGEELPRATVQFRVGADPDAAIQAIQRFGQKTGDGDERLRVGALKLGVDGGYTGAAAWTLQPYKGQPDFNGSQFISQADLYKLVRFAHDRGWQMGFHAIGDAAIKLTVDVFAQVLDESPRTDHRHYLNHFTVLPPHGTLQKMADYDIHIAQQPNFTYTLEGRYAEHLVDHRLQTNNPLRTPMNYGIFMALGSDILPIGPVVGLYTAVTRKGMSGEVYGEGERLSMVEAIIGYTRNAAYLAFEEDIKGTLEVGKLADLVVLSDDLLTIDPERIMDVKVDLTVVGGKVLYER